MKVMTRWNSRILGCLLAVLFLMGCAKSTEQQISEQMELGQKYLAEAKYEEAIAAFQKVIELDVKNLQAYEFLGQAYVDSGKEDLAIQILESGMEAADGAALDQSYLDMLADLYENQMFVALQSEENDRAVDYCGMVLALNPNDQEREKHLADIYINTADEKAGNGKFEEAIDILEAFEQRDVVKEKLQEVKDLHTNWMLGQVKKKAGYEDARSCAWGYGDYDNDGLHELFVEFRNYPTGNCETYIWFCNSDASYSEQIYSFALDEPVTGYYGCRRGGKWHCFGNSKGYSRDTITSYHVFTVRDGSPVLLKYDEEANIPDSEYEQYIENLMKS